MFITDTLGDIREASEMDIKSIGVTWGFHNRETLKRGNPFNIAEKPEDLSSAIDNYFQ
ncbi:hypothetical protein KKC45_03125 [Patescibacteria group bacterium]|nr:hypothetical protein [Patescibacteria group bacterium]